MGYSGCSRGTWVYRGGLWGTRSTRGVVLGYPGGTRGVPVRCHGALGVLPSSRGVLCGTQVRMCVRRACPRAGVCARACVCVCMGACSCRWLCACVRASCPVFLRLRARLCVCARLRACVRVLQLLRWCACALRDCVSLCVCARAFVCVRGTFCGCAGSSAKHLRACVWACACVRVFTDCVCHASAAVWALRWHGGDRRY